MDLLQTLAGSRLLAVVRGSDPSGLLATVATLVDEGITTLEISLTSSDAVSVLDRTVKEFGDQAIVGAGTVLEADQVRATADAGAAFVVTPAVCPAVQTAAELNLPVVAGAFTPSEILAVRAAGATAVKVFPASLGGPEYVAALRQPFPDISLVPFGGVDAAAAPRYLASGAMAVGVGSPLVRDAADGGDLDALRGRCRELLAAIHPQAP